MKAYRVTHQTSGDSFFLLADSPRQAAETVTLHFRSPEGPIVWSATSVDFIPELTSGMLLDADGKPA